MSDAQRRARAKYDAANTVQIHLKLNTKTDADILQKLEEVGSKQGYIKDLIRKDLQEGMNMEKRWVIVDDCTTKAAACWDEPLQVKTKAEAVEEAWSRWNSLTKHDQDRRDAFYVGLCGYDEDGLLDLDTMEECETIK